MQLPRAEVVVLFVRRHAGMALIAGLLALVCAVITIRPWSGFLSVPWGEGDAVYYYTLASTLIRFGWITYNPDLGYPGAMDLGYFPMPEFRSWGALWLITRVVDDPVVALNLLFIWGFFLVGAASYLLFVATVRREWLALVLAVVAATLPWHFTRFNHVLLADYSPVPLALLVGFLMWRGWWDRSTARWLLVVGVAVYIGLGGLYYTFFAMLGWAPILAWRIWATRDGKRIARDLAIPAVTAASLALAVVIFRSAARQPSVAATFSRSPQESLAYAGNPLTLFAPWPFWEARAVERAGNVSLIVALALLLSLAVLALLARWGGTSDESDWAEFGREVTPWLRLTVWFLLWFTPGLGFLFSLGVTPVIRSWGRLSLEISYTVLVVLGIALRTILVSRPQLLPTIAGTMGVLLAWQLTRDHQPLLAPSARATFAAAEEYATSVRDELPRECPILQLPIMAFPEDWTLSRDFGVGAYDHMWVALAAPDYRWSFGAVRGTEDGLEAEARYPAGGSRGLILANAREDGFCAVHVDTQGLAPESLENLRALLGEPVVESPRWALYRLTPA